MKKPLPYPTRIWIVTGLFSLDLFYHGWAWEVQEIETGIRIGIWRLPHKSGMTPYKWNWEWRRVVTKEIWEDMHDLPKA